MERKYFKPKSMGWWASMAMVGSGGFLAFEPVHQMAEMTAAVGNLYGNTSGAMLLNAGLLGLGIRGMNG